MKKIAIRKKLCDLIFRSARRKSHSTFTQNELKGDTNLNFLFLMMNFSLTCFS